MRVQHLAAVVATWLLFGTMAQAADPPLEYTVTPLMTGGGLSALVVEAVFQGDRSGRTCLELPDHWAEAEALWQHVDGLAVSGGRLEPDAGAVRWITHAPGARLRVSYRIPLSAEPDRNHPKGQPVVRPDWFMLHGEALFAVPAGHEAAPGRFRWGARPAGWTLASDLEHTGGRLAHLADLTDSVLVGSIRAQEVQQPVGHGRLRVVLIGDWTFKATAFADAAARVISAENGFWRDPGRDFLVTVTPLGPAVGGAYSSTGTGKRDAFSIESTTNADLTKDPHFLAHEYMHSWIAGQVGGLPKRDEARDYWFSEGFTDFYATRALLRSGVWSLEDVAAKYNEVLARYDVSSARNLTADQVTARFWKDDEATQSPYDRGRLLAAIWDHRIRVASGGHVSLDEVLRRQRRLAAQPPKDATGASLFPIAVAAVAPSVDVRADLDRHVVRGETLRLPADVFDGCLAVFDMTVPVFELGFDARRSGETGVISGVDPAGPAYAAGLRDGMKRIAREGGRNGDSRVEVGYRVAGADGVERVIRWRPEGRTKVTFQQVRVPTDLTPARRSACTRLLGGS